LNKIGWSNRECRVKSKDRFGILFLMRWHPEQQNGGI